MTPKLRSKNGLHSLPALPRKAMSFALLLAGRGRSGHPVGPGQVERMHRTLRCGAMTIAVVSFTVLLVPSVVRAQARIEVGVRGSYVPLYEGDATVGPTHGWGVTTQVAVTLDPAGASEAAVFYTLVPRDEDPYNRTPRIQMAGVLVSLSRGIRSRLTGVGMVGLGVIAYTPQPIVPCVPPGCFQEGGGSYARERHPTFVAGLGIEGALSSRLRVRADVKEHLPVGAGEASGGTGERRTDIGIGLRLLLVR